MRYYNRVYFASPFFTPEQIEREERLKAKLRELGFNVWSPKEFCVCPPDATDEMRQNTFNENCNAINCCNVVFAVTDGKDMGTIWEAGYAFGRNVLNESIGFPKTKIVYYCETLKGGQFNLMLAQSGDVIITKFEDLDTLPELLEKGIKVGYDGAIE